MIDNINNKTSYHHASNLMSDVVSTKILDEAFKYIYDKRQKDSANSDIWSLSIDWLVERQKIQTQMLSNTYQLSPVACYYSATAGRLTRWNSRDAVVLKAVSALLSQKLEQHIDSRCYHLKHRGGLKAGVRAVAKGVSHGQFVLKSDVASFYDSMSHETVLKQCKKLIKDKRILQIIAQYLNRVEVQDGEHRLINQGIPKGCPLSPLMGALMLKSLDDSLPEDCFYARYMDDWVILVKTRRLLRRVVKTMHRVMQTLGFKLALAKTYIGKVSNGFDFLGYRFNHQGIIGLAGKTVQNFIERMFRLYEQGATHDRILAYVRRWCSWCTAGLH